MTTIYGFSATDIDGATVELERYRGQVMLIVNVASRCGFTPQYGGLETLYRTHAGRGFVVLGFPCNQFGGQEPGDEAQIRSFCSLTYDVSFPMFARVDVNGRSAHPLFTYLKSEAPGLLGSTGIKWNFTKFLVGRDGTVQRRYAPAERPDRIEADIIAALG